jgi:hypothetical protein
MRDTFYPYESRDDDEFQERMKTARHWLWYALDVTKPPSHDNRVDHLSDNWLRLAWFILKDKTIQKAIHADRFRHVILPPPDKRKP